MIYVKTTYTDETALISNILGLYNNREGVDLDPCYSKGRFWKGLPQPRLKFDFKPQTKDTVQADVRNLPLEGSTINSIMFDPPFVIGIGKSTGGIMRNRFSGFRDLNELMEMYTSSLYEFFRIMNKKGLLIFKCQDTVTSGKQFATHIFIVNTAVNIGYMLEDIFILVKDRAMIDPKWNGQKHARKTHCYYLVLRKK